MSTFAKTALVLLGYIAAFLIADRLLDIHVARTVADSRGADGMYAFGDAIFFLGVFGLLALIPTGAAVYFLRQGESPWTGVSKIALTLAATAPVAALLLFAAHRAESTAVEGVPEVLWSIALVRLMVSPLLFPIFLACGAFAKDFQLRKKFFLAAVIEFVSLVLIVAVFLLTWH